MNGKRLVNLSTFSTEMGVEFYLQDDGSVLGSATLQKGHEGPPFHVHGGVLASLLDEAMGAAAWASGKRVVAVNLNFNFRKPVPLGMPLRIEGRVDRVERRKNFTVGQLLLPDGAVAVEGTGIFVEAPHIFENMSNPFAHVPEE
ncbi:MAG: PaaI family thioesterase [Anaerolineae bacterium]